MSILSFKFVSKIIGDIYYKKNLTTERIVSGYDTKSVETSENGMITGVWLWESLSTEDQHKFLHNSLIALQKMEDEEAVSNVFIKPNEKDIIHKKVVRII